MEKIAFKTVDEYLAAVPEMQRKTLEKVRQAIKAAAPQAQELISYGIPLYTLNGHVAGLGAFKNHNSYFATSYAVLERFAEELKAYKVAGTTVHFPIDKPLPASLVKKMVLEKIKENQAREKTKSSKKAAAKK